MQAPEVQDERRRHPEINEVGKAVELGAETRGALEHPRDPAVDAVKQRCKHDRRHRPFELLLEGEPDRGQSGAETQQGDEVGDQHPHGDGAEAPAFRRLRIRFVRF